MRTIRLRRVAVLFVAALGLLATAAPPAQAATAATIVIDGNATLTNPLSYPCVGAGPTVNTTKCATVVVNGVNGFCYGGHTECVQGGNSSAVAAFASSVCAGGGVYQNVAVDPAAGCSITRVPNSASVVTGSCGLSSGLVIVSIEFSTISQTVLLIASVHWVAVGGDLIITGLVDTGEKVYGVVNATPTGNPGTSDNSCAQKTATNFRIQGSASLVG